MALVHENIALIDRRRPKCLILLYRVEARILINFLHPFVVILGVTAAEKLIDVGSLIEYVRVEVLIGIGSS